MQGVIEKVAILILDSCGCVVERYIINLRVSFQDSSTSLEGLPWPDP